MENTIIKKIDTVELEQKVKEMYSEDHSTQHRIFCFVVSNGMRSKI
jgi:hypothetical protein